MAKRGSHHDNESTDPGLDWFSNLFVVLLGLALRLLCELVAVAAAMVRCGWRTFSRRSSSGPD